MKNVRQLFHEASNLVSHPAVTVQCFFLRLGGLRQLWRIIEADVDEVCLTWKDRTVLVRVVANSYDVIELDVFKLIDMFRALMCDIHSRFRHNLYGELVQTVYLDTR